MLGDYNVKYAPGGHHTRIIFDNSESESVSEAHNMGEIWQLSD